jgi:protein TonB
LAAISGHVREPSGPANLARAARPRPQRVEIVAITSDDLLLEQIGQVLDGQSTIRQADNPADARALLRPSQPSVVLLDTRGHDDLALVVQDLQSPDGTSIVVLFAPADASADIARAVRGSATFAVLPIPVVPVQATAVIEGACEECLARHALLAAPSPAPAPVRDDPVASAPPAPTSSAPPEAAIPPVRTSGRRRDTDHRSKFLAVGACVALLAATVAWFSLREPTAVRKLSATQPQAPKSSTGNAADIVRPGAMQEGSVDELLESARAAMRERRYTDSDGNSALNYFRSVLTLDPGNGEAREGLQRVAAVLHERVQAALDARQIEEAGRTLAELRSIRPDDAGLASFEAAIADARIQKALAESDVERARDLLKQAAGTGALSPDAVTHWRAELDRQQAVARAGQLAQLVSLRIRQGQLLEPAEDSAKHYLAQLRGLPASPRALVADATTQLQQACLDRFRDAVSSSQRPEADRWKAEARALGVSATELAAVQRDVSARTAVSAARKEAARVAQLVQDRIADGRLLEPSNDSALFHLNALRTLDPSGSAVAASERDLSAKLLEQGRSALADGRMNVARDDAAAARVLGLNLDNVAALERDIAGASPGGALPASRQASALTRTRYVAPEYPQSALAQRVRGDVHLRLTVDAEGKVSDAVVIQANPPKVFDAAAIAAARKWRFKPIGTKGSGVEATVTVAIVFQPEDAKP